MRKDIALHFVAISLGIILFGIGERMKTLPDIVTAVLFVCGGILLIIGILGLTGAWNKLVSRLKHQPKMAKISPIERIEHDKKPSTISSYFAVLFFSACLILGLLVIITWVFVQAPKQISMFSMLNPIFFLIAPIYVLVDMFVIRRKYYRLNRSSVVKDADFAIDGNANYIFDNCRRILLTMNATITRAKPLKLIKAHLGKATIVVEIKRRKDSRINVYIISDVLCWIAKRDDGSNQNNIDAFIKLLYEAIGTK